MFRPSAPVDCFYCQSDISPPPKNSRNFRCPHCQCWNRYDSTGEILSDEPAMHDPDLNSRSFARRAFPRKDRFLSSYGGTVFCHTCQTNQMLLTNLLSNYLPPSEDPDYDKRLEMLSEYQTSVQRRYPPVCSSCLPAVEEEIRTKNHMARTNALGCWLKQSKGKHKQATSTLESLAKFDRDLRIWKVRGCLWVFALFVSVVGHTAVAFFGYRISPTAVIPTQVLPAIIVIIFPLVCLWSPTDAAIKRAKHQGRDLRLQGRTAYIGCQMIIWLLRLLSCTILFLSSSGPHRNYLRLTADDLSSRSRLYCSTSLMLELSLLVLSLSVLQLHRPPAIRLTYPDGRSSSVPLAPTEISERASTSNIPSHDLDLLASLTLSTKPVIRTNPMFGIPSFHHSPQSLTQTPEQDDPDAMDWTPTNPAPKMSSSPQDYGDNSLVKPQHFFPPEEVTGLERLLARTNLVETSVSPSPTSPTTTSLKSVKWSSWICALFLVSAAAMIRYRLWIYSWFFGNTYIVVQRALDIIEQRVDQ